MTQTLIEKLESLTRIHQSESGDGGYVYLPSVIAIIEQAKAEKQEPVAWKDKRGTIMLDKSIHESWKYIDIVNSVNNKTPPLGFKPFLYRSPQPDIVAELVKALEETVAIAEAHINGLNCTGPKALIAKAKEMM